MRLKNKNGAKNLNVLCENGPKRLEYWNMLRTATTVVLCFEIFRLTAELAIYWINCWTILQNDMDRFPGPELRHVDPHDWLILPVYL